MGTEAIQHSLGTTKRPIHLNTPNLNMKTFTIGLLAIFFLAALGTSQAAPVEEETREDVGALEEAVAEDTEDAEVEEKDEDKADDEAEDEDNNADEDVEEKEDGVEDEETDEDKDASDDADEETDEDKDAVEETDEDKDASDDADK